MEVFKDLETNPRDTADVCYGLAQAICGLGSMNKILGHTNPELEVTAGPGDFYLTSSLPTHVAARGGPCGRVVTDMP